jgi:hypothetical protein
MTSARSVTPDADRSSILPDKPGSPSLECRRENSTTYSIPTVDKNETVAEGWRDGDGGMVMREEEYCYSISSKVNGYTTTTSVAGGRL